MKHQIPDSLKNSDVIRCIDEFVRLERDRQLLKDHWFHGLTIEKLSEKYDVSPNAVKRVLYSVGDKILLKIKND